LNNHYTYFLILGASLAGPLALSFDKKVAFYKKWKFVFPAMLLPAIIYIAWDSYFTAIGIWSFNEIYITGHKIFGLPIEEVLFFFIVPYCCVFIYACIRAYFPLLKNNRQAEVILILLGLALGVAGLLTIDKYYTSWTALFNFVFIALLFLFRKFYKSFDAISFLISYAICLVPFLVVNGFLTAIPVVLYNDAENLGTRIYTIPVEDVFYGMLLVLMNIVLYEKLQSVKRFREE
jgi:lycopene cyclase domain-containing protein